MANQPGRRQPFRFWHWANPTPTPRQPRRPAARAPPRTPSPSAATPSPSRRPSRQPPATLAPPSPTKEATQPPQKEAAAATQEVSPAPSLYPPSVSQPESATQEPVEPEAPDSGVPVEALARTIEQPKPEFPTRPEPQEQSPSELASQPLNAGSQTPQVSEPETASVDTVLEREPKEIKEEKSVTSEEEGEESKKEPPPIEEKPQIDAKSKKDSEPSQLPSAAQIDMESKQDGEPSQSLPVKKEAQIDAKEGTQPSQPLPVGKRIPIDTESKQGTQPSQPLPVEKKAQIDMQSKQDTVEKKLQIDTESKQDGELKEATSHIPQVKGKSEEIIEGKPDTELKVIKRTEHEESIEEKQPSPIPLPREKEKPEEVIKKTDSTEDSIEKKQPTQTPQEKEKTEEVIKKTEPKESVEEKQPSQIPQEKEKPEEIIEGKPKTDLKVIKKTEPRSPKSETASHEESKNDEHKTEPEALPAEASSLFGDESNGTTEIQISVTEPDFEAPEPHLDTSEVVTEPGSPVKQTYLDGSKGREGIMGARRIPWASSSLGHGERASFHREINEGISNLVQKLKLGQSQQPGSEGAVSIITLAGENNGATMFVGRETTKKESVPHTNTKAEASSGNKDIQKQVLNHADSENPAITASINSNVQGINNSLLHESGCSEEDPGVHLVLSVKPSELAKSKEKVESSAASEASAK